MVPQFDNSTMKNSTDLDGEAFEDGFIEETMVQQLGMAGDGRDSNSTVLVDKLTTQAAWIRMPVSAFILAVNCLTIVTFIRVRQLRTKSNMLVVSLAFTDLLVGFAVLASSVTLFGVDELQDSAACIMRNALFLLACSVSIINICFISMERYVYIVHPYVHLEFVGNKMLGLAITLSWTLGAVYGGSLVLVYEYRIEDGCQFYSGGGSIVGVYVPFGIFASSGTVTLICYSLIGRMVFKKRQQLQPNNLASRIFTLRGRDPEAATSTAPSSSPQPGLQLPDRPVRSLPTNFALRSSLKALKAPVVVFGVFFITWAPHMVIYMVHDLWFPISRTWRSSITNIALANSALNFFVYLIFNARFRRAIFCCPFCARCMDPELD